MLNHIIRVKELNNLLGRMDEDALSRLYMRVFNTDDGNLVLQDIANRAFVHVPTSTPFDEGKRAVYLSILTRLSGVDNKEE